MKKYWVYKSEHLAKYRTQHEMLGFILTVFNRNEMQALDSYRNHEQNLT